MEIIKITQLPLVEDMLEKQGESIKQELAHVETLACTEENKKSVKKMRSSYSADLKAFDEQFKLAIKELEEPVKRLKTAYKEHIQTPYKNADKILKDKISIIEDFQKSEKETAAKEYFEEYKLSVDNGLIDFVQFNHCILVVGLSESLASLKKTIKNTLDLIVGETNSIAMMEDKELILFEYQQHLNFAKAVSNSIERKEKIAKAKENLEKRTEEQEKTEVVETVTVATEILQAPTVEKTVETVQKVEKDLDEIISVKFEVTGRREDVRKLGVLLKANNLDYNIL